MQMTCIAKVSFRDTNGRGVTDECRQLGVKCDNGALLPSEHPDRRTQRQAEKLCGGATCKCSDTPAAKYLVNIYFSYP